MIAAIGELLPGNAHLVIGIGDDAAVVRAPDRRVVATTDMLIEERHFRRDWSAPRDIGHKAAARNLADIAAMGARPTALLVAFAGPANTELGWVLDLVTGIAQECSAAGASVAGGDTSSADKVVLAITALGDLAGQGPVTRGGARPGDVVAIAGSLGSAAAGLALLSAGLAGKDHPLDADLAELVSAHCRPRPPYRAGPQAASLGASSMIDISDGLVADLGHVAAASGVRIELRSSLVAAEPVARARSLAKTQALLPRSPSVPGRRLAGWKTWVLTGGDDHALAATFPAGVSLPENWTIAGEVVEGNGIGVDGHDWGSGGGWEHFRSQLHYVFA